MDSAPELQPQSLHVAATTTNVRSLVTVALLAVVLVGTLAVTMSVPATTTTTRFATTTSTSTTSTHVEVRVKVDSEHHAGLHTSSTVDQTLSGTAAGQTSVSSQVKLVISRTATTMVENIRGTSTNASPESQQPHADKAPASNLTVAECVSLAAYACENKGTEACSWALDNPASQGCGFHAFRPTGLMLPTDKLPPQPLHHRRIVFHGDSTLREVFNAAGLGLFGHTMGVSKQDANMSSRAVLHRSSNVTRTHAAFRFDYTFDHLEHPIDSVMSTSHHYHGARSSGVDAVVVGMGLYHARMLQHNRSIHVDLATGTTVFEEGPIVPMEYLQATAVKRVIHLVCDAYRAPVGYFLGTWMDCAHLKVRIRGAPPRKARMSYSQCTKEHTWVKRINSMLEVGFLREHAENPRPDGCRVHYIPAIKCQGTKHPCLPDAVHTRPNGLYATAKSQVLINAMITTWRQNTTTTTTTTTTSS